MAEPNLSDGPVSSANGDAAFQACHDYRWDLDKDFLGGLVLALGGYHALARTASQADIIMHSRLFYYARVSGVSIPYASYRQWLRDQLLHGRNPPRIWEWDLLEALCSHRDRLGAGSAPPPPPPPPPPSDQATVAAEKDLWTRELLRGGGGGYDYDDDGGGASAAAPNGGGTSDPTAPAWMAAAPRVPLYVDRAGATNQAAGNDGDDDDVEEGSGQVPYPERFAAIIKAVQSGEPIEGIVEIPDIVARNPTTTPFGKMSRPRKPWESAQDSTSDDRGDGLENSLDQSFPEQEDGVHQSG